jgi:tetratricopeptide (TPR) repeat protein
MRRGVIGMTVLMLATTFAPAARAAPQSAADLLDVPKLLDDLSNTDSAVRQSASDKLTAIGETARPELITAARSDDPERRVRAAEILRKLPWHTGKDDKAIRALLERYGPADDRVRMGLIWQLSDVNGGVDVMLRLLAEEPSHAVRWFLVALLSSEREPATQKKFLALGGTASDDAPVLVLIGNTLIERDRRRALELFRRAIEAEEQRPGSDIGVLAIAFDALVDDALARGDVETAAAMLRRQVPRDALPQFAVRRTLGQGEPHTFARLMALHTYFGPLSRHDEDVAAWGDGRAVATPANPPIAMVLAGLGVAPPVPSHPVEFTGQEHLTAGGFLMRNKLNVAAESELLRALNSYEATVMPSLEADTCFALGRLTGERNDDVAAANYLERAMKIKAEHQMVFSRGVRRADDDVWAEIHFRRARVADGAGDAKTANARVKSLLQLMPTHNDETIEMIVWLKQSSRVSEARTLFDKVYVQAKAKLDSATEDRKAGMKNDLAWLCARVDEHLDEALTLAREASEAQPDNAAFLDTLAEACFRAGRTDEAVLHETRALQLEPDNDFMKEQLDRFRRGK